jgi:ppGpp synthetase/RelA/SpoT-type nucleotidyltranferase
VTSEISKTQIDLLGDRLKKGATTDPDLRLLDSFRRSFAPAYEDVISTVKEVLAFDVTGRPAKSTTSIIEKLRRESIRLTQMQDIAGCRFVVSDIRSQNSAIETLVAELSDTTIIDRRERPSHGYRAVHLVATVHDKPIEVQIRTTLQHLWAEFSEKAADIFDPGIKYGTGPADLLHVLSGYSGLLEDVELDELELAEAQPDPRLDEFKQELREKLEELIKRIGALKKSKKE